MIFIFVSLVQIVNNKMVRFSLWSCSHHWSLTHTNT